MNLVPFSPPNGLALNFGSPHLTDNTVVLNSCDAFPPTTLVNLCTSRRQLGIKRRAETLGLTLASTISHSWAPWPCCFAALSITLCVYKLGVRASMEHCREDCMPLECPRCSIGSSGDSVVTAGPRNRTCVTFLLPSHRSPTRSPAPTTQS